MLHFSATRGFFRALALFLLGAAAFSAAYCQAPLYYSNQNQYFLHGLADADEGLLQEDWLACTRDATPVFTALVAVTARYLHPWVFHIYYALLFGTYAAAMLGLFTLGAGAQVAARRWPVFVALFVAVHAALPRWCSGQWLGQDYPWYFQAGVAGQYILGAMFQPSTFGILLVVAVYLFARGWPFLAALCVALAASVHSTYLLPAALLTLGFLTVLLWERRLWQAVGVGALALALVLPVTVYVVTTFGPTSPAEFAEAQNILANFRIPHHARPDLWLDGIAGLQIAWLVLGLLLARPLRLFLVLAVPFLLSVVLTLVQVATGNDTLALLFPWRISSVLVPIATTVILSRVVVAAGHRLENRVAWVTAAVAVAGLVAAGVWIRAGGLAFRLNDEELPMMNFVRTSRMSGDVYLLPVRVPDLPPQRGSLSSDYKPLPDKKRDQQIIPLDLQRFRLCTGTPIFIDFKSIPYKDTEVLEWYARIRLAEALQKQLQQGRQSAVLAELQSRGITHLVLPAGQEIQGAGFHQLYGDAYYRVYRLDAGADGG